LKQFFRVGAKVLEWAQVLTASDEGHAGAGVLLVLGCAVPGVDVVCAIGGGFVGGVVVGEMIGNALYDWWNGPDVEAPMIDLHSTEPIEYPDRHVEHVEQPPPEPEPPAPNMIHLSITNRNPGD